MSSEWQGKVALPTWFEGVKQHSEPGALALDLMQEVQAIQLSSTEDNEKIKDTNMRLDALQTFHEGHRALIHSGVNPYIAVQTEGYCMILAFEDDRLGDEPAAQPYNSYRVEDVRPFMRKVIAAYADFYASNVDA
jgi:hypothetical protein